MGTEFLDVHILEAVTEGSLLKVDFATNRRRALPDGSVWDSRSLPLIKRWASETAAPVLAHDGTQIGRVLRLEDAGPSQMKAVIELATPLTGDGFLRAGFHCVILDVKKGIKRPGEERLVARPQSFVVWMSQPVTVQHCVHKSHELVDHPIHPNL